jgi:MFS transporter, DHA2 family, multidrug resistance protein
MKRNEMMPGANLEKVNPLDTLFGKLQQHAMIVSMKEIYGWLCIAGILCLLTFQLRESLLRPKSFHTKFSTLRYAVKHELKIDKLNKDG